jgi:hypothetical protein
MEVKKIADSFQKPGVQILNEIGAWQEDTVEKFDSLPNREKIDFLLSHTHNSLGRCALLLNEPGEAESHFFVALEKGRPLGDPSLLVPVLANYQSSQLNLQPQTNPSVRPPPEGLKLLADPEDTRAVRKLYARLNSLLTRFVNEKEDMVIDDYPVFHQEDPFLSGKLLMGMAYWVSELPIGHPLTAWRCQRVRESVPLLLKLPCKTWGTFFFLRALLHLRDRGLLNTCLSAEDFQSARDRLHWQDFVDPASHRLIKKPNNFYQVAFAIALYRFQLGWDSSDPLYIFLERMLTHIEEVSRNSGFADETEGEGRFDRYSVLFVAEICHRLREAGLPLPEKIKPWLRNCAELALYHINADGYGFCYGRSIGAYGETAFLEVLSAAAWAGVLSEEEKAVAFAFTQTILQRFLRFWWKESTGSVDLWGDGQKTEKYRGKFRILGENLSLLHQHIYTVLIWQDLGFSYEGACHIPTPFVDKLPRGRLFSFGSSPQHGDHYATYFWRHQQRQVIAVPLINAATYHEQSVYLPIPQSPLFTFPKPQEQVPYLLPKFIFSSGEQALPTAFFENIRASFDQQGNGLLEWHTPVLNLLGEDLPRGLDSCLTIQTKMHFKPDSITRTDSIRFKEYPRLRIKEITLSLPKTFVESKASGRNKVYDVHEAFISRFETQGYFSETLANFNPCTHEENNNQELIIFWTLNFR